jgi:hypothetical protein
MDLVTHFSQPNTGEFGMALEWRLLRNRQRLQSLKLFAEHQVCTSTRLHPFDNKA